MRFVRRKWALVGWVIVLLIGQVFAGAAEQKSAGVLPARALPVGRSTPPSASSEVVCIACPAPEYPIEAAQRGIGGVVDLEVTVTEDGRVEGVKVLAAPCDELKEAAVKAAQTWSFKPAMHAGKPVRGIVQIPCRVPTLSIPCSPPPAPLKCSSSAGRKSPVASFHCMGDSASQEIQPLRHRGRRIAL